MPRLEGKVALVTGGGGPMGKAVAARFAEEGADLAVCDISGARIRDAEPELRALLRPGGRLVAARVNARDEAEVARFCARVAAELGAVDLLVNVVGGFRGKFEQGVVDIPARRWADTFDLNLMPSVHLVKRLAPGMVERGYGRIVNIASVDAHGQAWRADYSAAKAAVMAFTRALAVELAPHVLVNCIAPGVINTLALRGATPATADTKSGTNRYMERSILKRHGEPREIANAALFLASSECSYMTGEVLRISGGIQANL